MIDPRDIAEVGAIALTKPGHEGKDYYITGPDTLNQWEIADIFTEVVRSIYLSNDRYQHIEREYPFKYLLLLLLLFIYIVGKKDHLRPPYR